jgi:1,4-alpha-glucan branching enzyme
MEPVAPAVTPAGVRFVLMRPEAKSVALAGSFNQWSASAHPLTRGARGAWAVIVALPAGEHLFMYVVDGAQWISPPVAEDYVDDGFGARNAIVVVHEVH